jgi:cystathionine beta-synthase
MPVVENDQLIGSISEKTVLKALLSDAGSIHKTVGEFMGALFPYVAVDDDISKVSSLISKEHGAVLVKDAAGNTHIITQYDLIHSIGNV